MAAVKISKEQVAINAYDIGFSVQAMAGRVYDQALEESARPRTSKAYEIAQKGAGYLVDKTENMVGRLSGASYCAKTLQAVVGMFKDVDTGHLVSTIRDPAKSLTDKVKDVVSHMNERFSHESTVAASVFLGKKALIITPMVMGVTALTGLIAPAAAATAGAVTAAVAPVAAMYYLATHAGHGLEASAAEKVQKGSDFILGFNRAARGKDPACGQLAELGQKMDHAGREMHAHDQAPGSGKHGKDHGHGGHKHQHGGFLRTLGKDLVSLVSVHKYPEKVVSYVKEIANDCKKLHDYCKNRGKGPEVEKTAPSRFMRQEPPITPHPVKALEAQPASRFTAIQPQPIKVVEDKPAAAPPQQAPAQQKVKPVQIRPLI